MGEVTNNESSEVKKSWFKELKGEFKKIIWPDKQSLAKQTTVVILLSAVLGVAIWGIDTLYSFGVTKLFG